MNHTEPYYLGIPMQVGDMTFTCGGWGVILSSEALRRVSEYRAEEPTEVKEITTNNWAGDSVLPQSPPRRGCTLVLVMALAPDSLIMGL